MYTAVIFEFRKHKALSFVLNNFLENLSNEWNILIFHGNKNVDYVNNIIKNDLFEYNERACCNHLDVDNLTPTEYSDLLKTNKYIYQCIPSEIFLIFQTDTMIFKNYRHIINNFLKYDYVGAPWVHNNAIRVYDAKTNVTLRNCSNYNVGNGGLSLRKKTKMIEIIDTIDRLNTYDLYKNIPEDVFFSCNEFVPIYKPTHDEAKFFSIENDFSYAAFGCHKPWLLLESDNRLLEYYPEIEKLYELQCSEEE